MGLFTDIGRKIVPNSFRYVWGSFKETNPWGRRLAFTGGVANSVIESVSGSWNAEDLAASIATELLLFFGDMNSTLIGITNSLKAGPSWWKFIILTGGVYSIVWATIFVIRLVTDYSRKAQGISRDRPRWMTTVFISLPLVTAGMFITHIGVEVLHDGVFTLPELVWPWQGFLYFAVNAYEIYWVPLFEFLKTLGIPGLAEKVMGWI